MKTNLDNFQAHRIQQFYAANDCDILLEQEVGSWTWGYNAIDSDHDLLVIYAHKQLERLLFNTNKVTPGLDLVEHSFEWSKFIALALKFNFNAFAYCQAALDNSLQSGQFCRFNQWYQQECQKHRTVILKKLFIQIVSQVNTYYQKRETVKDFIRFSYMCQLAMLCYYQLVTNTQLDKHFILNIRMQDFETFKSQFADQNVIDLHSILLQHLEFAHKKMTTKYNTAESRQHKLDYQYKNIMQTMHCVICANLGYKFRKEKFDLPIYSTQTKVDLYKGVL